MAGRIESQFRGEQFVVLFSLIVSVMNYTRSLTSSLSTTSGVLILDNPFGPISSPHLLEPMFRIARHCQSTATPCFFNIRPRPNIPPTREGAECKHTLLVRVLSRPWTS